MRGYKNLAKIKSKLTSYPSDYDINDHLYLLEYKNFKLYRKKFNIKYTTPNGKIISDCPLYVNNGIKRATLFQFNQIKNEDFGYRMIILGSSYHIGMMLFYKKLFKLYESGHNMLSSIYELQSYQNNEQTENDLNDSPIVGEDNDIDKESRDIIYNAIETPDGTILESRHRHDYKSYTDTISGENYIVDGGIDYIRRSVNTIPYKELSLYLDDSHTVIREQFNWGTYGKNGDEPLKYVILADMSDEHIEAILKTQKHISNAVRTVFENELSYRDKYEIYI